MERIRKKELEEERKVELKIEIDKINSFIPCLFYCFIFFKKNEII
jgi:hypothetical protein